MALEEYQKKQNGHLGRLEKKLDLYNGHVFQALLGIIAILGTGVSGLVILLFRWMGA